MSASSHVPILVVDDDATKRLALIAILARLGHTIVEADSGEAALRRLMTQDFAVILLDVRMPGMDGFETASLIRLRQQSEMTPIIFITAYTMDELAGADRYAEGAVDFICGPIQPEELRAKVSVFASLFLRAEELAAQAREVEQSADMVRSLTDAAPIGIFRTDADSRYVYINPRFTEITGLTPDDALGREYGSIHDAGRRGRPSELVDDGGTASEISHRFEIQPHGCDPRIVLVTARRMHHADGSIVGWVGTIADVTFEVSAELAMTVARDQATEASRMKSDFLANMSHEIRTPMNGVIGMTDLLLDTDLDARQRDYAMTVRNSGKALLGVIDDILDFSKVEAGMLEIESVGFDVCGVVEEVVTLLSGLARAKGVELISFVDPAVPANVSGDPGRVRQVLTNLIGNAIKFTADGEVVVRAGVVDTDGDEVVVRFEVTDTGDGISEDKLATIFQPFVQADTSTSRKYGGTGLGLAISRRLVALMGGTCGVTSRLRSGSEFWFTIAVRTQPGPAALEAADPGLNGVAALVVDANAAQRAVLSEYMRGWGMTVTEAASSRGALATLRTASLHGRPFALAVIDQRMDETIGVTLEDVIAGDPALRLGLVTMTGLGDRAQGALPKPVHRRELEACLRVAAGVEPAAPEHLSAATTPSPPEPAPAPGAAGRVLLAEDNLINQKVAVAMLSGAGYHVDTVPNGLEAVRSATTQRYDAILMDCQMPELNGYEATAAIRVHEGTARHTPIIAMTAGALPADRELCLESGMDSYLAKPVGKDALLALVARWIDDPRRPTAGSL